MLDYIAVAIWILDKWKDDQYGDCGIKIALLIQHTSMSNPPVRVTECSSTDQIFNRDLALTSLSARREILT